MDALAVTAEQSKKDESKFVRGIGQQARECGRRIVAFGNFFCRTGSFRFPTQCVDICVWRNMSGRRTWRGRCPSPIVMRMPAAPAPMLRSNSPILIISLTAIFRRSFRSMYAGRGRSISVAVPAARPGCCKGSGSKSPESTSRKTCCRSHEIAIRRAITAWYPRTIFVNFRRGTFDAVLSAFAFDNIPGAAKIRIFADLAKLLKTNGVIINIVSSPQIYTHEWASFTTKDFPENASAASGDIVRIITTDHADRRPVEDILWTDESYRAVYRAAGLEMLAMYEPLASGEEPYAWVNETKIAPWVIYVLKRAG